MKRLALILVVALLPGCSTNYIAKNYDDATALVPGAQLEDLHRTLLPYSGTTRVTPTPDHGREAMVLAQRGYAPLGISGFSGDFLLAEPDVRKQAKKVGADIVVRSRVPNTTNRTSYIVSFWRKMRPPIFGAYPDVLPDEARKTLQRNTGAWIKIVQDDTPAFRANLLVGDVVIGLDDTEIHSPQELFDVLPRFAGKKTIVTILRNGEEQKIEVQMNSAAEAETVEKPVRRSRTGPPTQPPAGPATEKATKARA